MGKTVIWDPSAGDDLHQIYEFLQDEASEKYAGAVLEALFKGAELIDNFRFLAGLYLKPICHPFGNW